MAGRSWLHGVELYSYSRGFVYSPLAAALFAPFSLLPGAAGEIVWRALNVAVYLGAVVWWLRMDVQKGITRRHWAFVFLLLLPLSIGNMNNGQVNPIIIGMSMIALLAAREERWGVAAMCVALTTYFKIYPLAVGLLLTALFPRRYAWRLLLALLLLGAATFLFQRPAYVLDQYQRWFATRHADNRQLYKMDIAPRDLWMLLRLAHVTISEHFYTVIQMASGGAVALVCIAGRRSGWPRDKVFVVLLSLVTGWMLLCGPATESATYILLGPPVALALVEAFSLPASRGMRWWIAACYAVLVFALQLNSFFHFRKSIYSMSVQPIAALLFVGYVARWTQQARRKSC